MRPNRKSWIVALGSLATSLALGGVFAQAQLPVVGGGGVVPGVGGPGPVGPGIGGALPGTPNVGVPQVPNLNPGQNGTQRVLPKTDNVVRNRDNKLSGQNQVGPNMPLTVDGVKGTQIGKDGTVGAILDNRNGRLMISRIDDGSLFSKSGFKPGDRILAVDRSWVRSLNDFSGRLSAAAQAQGNASVYIVRNGVRQWLEVDFADVARPVLGVQLNDKDGQLIVSSVTQASAAAEAGLQVGDQIVSINGQTLNATADVAAQIAAAANIDGKVDLAVIRNGLPQTLHAVVNRAQGVTHHGIHLVHDRVGTIRDQLAKVGGNVNDVVRRDLDNLRQRVDTLSTRVNELAQSTKDMAKEDVDQIRDTSSALRGRIDDIASNAKDVTRTDLDRIHDEVSQLRSDVNNFAGDVMDSTRQFTESTRQGLTDMTKGIDDDLRALAGNAKDNVRGSVDDVNKLTAQLRDDISKLGNGQNGDFGDRLDAARDRISDVRNRLGDFNLGDADNGLDRNKLDDLRDRLAVVRDRLGDIREDRLGNIGNGQPQVGNLRDRLAGQTDALRDRISNLKLGDQNQAKDLTARITVVRDQLQNGFDRDDDHLAQFRNQIRDLRSQVNDLARKDRNAQGLDDARARIAALSDDVNDYVADHFQRNNSDSPVERVGSRVK